jgi:hypothetical protein
MAYIGGKYDFIQNIFSVDKFGLVYDYCFPFYVVKFCRGANEMFISQSMHQITGTFICYSELCRDANSFYFYCNCDQNNN